MFVWMDFREDDRFKREKWRERCFIECLVGKKKCGEICFLPWDHQKVFSLK